MGFLAKSVATILSVGVAMVRASPAQALEPVTTPAAILPRDMTRTLGWYASGETQGQTIYAPWEYDANATTYTTSSNYFRRCPVSTSCVMYTGCSSGYMVAAGTSSFCGISTATGAASTSYCSDHVLFPSLRATTGELRWYWCDVAPLTGNTFYVKQPAEPTFASASSSRGTSSTSTATSAMSTSPTATSATPAADGSKGSSTPVGAIVGGVVGGVAVLGALGFAIFCIMRRDKKKKDAPTAYQQAPGHSPQTEHYAVGAYQPNEQKPQGVVAQGYYPQSYPLGPYDPHASQQFAANPLPQELSAPGVLPPQELPAQQRSPE